MLKGGIRTVSEATLVVASGLAIALTANATSGRGLQISRDYFPGPPVVDAELRDEDHRVVDHEQVVEAFQSEAYLEERCIFIDARNDEQYAEGHIPGAYQLDHYRCASYLDAVLPACQEVERIILYCNSGECEDSKLAAGDLIEQGVDPAKLYVYGGGVMEWRADGLPFERGARLSDDIVYLDDEAEE